MSHAQFFFFFKLPRNIQQHPCYRRHNGVPALLWYEVYARQTLVYSSGIARIIKETKKTGVHRRTPATRGHQRPGERTDPATAIRKTSATIVSMETKGSTAETWWKFRCSTDGDGDSALLGGRPHPHQVGLPRGGREHQGPEGPHNTRGTCPRRMAMLSDGHLNFISFFNFFFFFVTRGSLCNSVSLFFFKFKEAKLLNG